MGDPSLFEQVVAASGLSPVFGRSAIERALLRVQLTPADLSTENLPKAIDSIKQAIAIFLKSPELERRVATILKLSR